jgi:16S rRNA (uracil1498-N3)-methyltransferase
MKRSIVKISNDKLDSKLSRFEKIAKEAAEQAHRLSIPEIIIVNSFKNIDFKEFDLKILLDEEEAKKEDGLLLKGVSFVNMKNISFVIGPEGGIDDSERSLLIENEFIPVSLGKNILRTETASLAFLAMIKYALLD